MTGPSRGVVTRIGAPDLEVCVTDRRFVHVSQAGTGQPPQNLVARLHRDGDSYEVEAAGEKQVWVNGKPVTAQRLRHCDMIEFGQTGPLSRFRLYGAQSPVRKTIADILSDSADYLRVSRQPVGNRLFKVSGELFWQLTWKTTILFRATVAVVLLAFVVLGYQQYRLNQRLEQSIESGAARVEGISAALTRAREEALREGDLEALREEIAGRVVSNAERLAALERRSRAAARVIADSIASVAFLQGSYGFRDAASGRRLRHVVSLTGVPLISPRGEPLLTLEGDGPVAELQFTGTGFLIGERGALLTNRHVALPAEQTAGGGVDSSTLEPVMDRFVAYFPGNAEPVPVELLLADENADLAVLRRANGPAVTPGLKLAPDPPEPGDEVIVMGYPTGLRSMLAQSGPGFIESLQEAGDTGFWEVAARLAEGGYIAPLASRGIAGQVTAETIVYDAETTHGGSGGPVLDMNGEVIAVNAAILPEYGGSNLGVPASKVRALLEEAGLR